MMDELPNAYVRVRFIYKSPHLHFRNLGSSYTQRYLAYLTKDASVKQNNPVISHFLNSAYANCPTPTKAIIPAMEHRPLNLYQSAIIISKCHRLCTQVIHRRSSRNGYYEWTDSGCTFNLRVNRVKLGGWTVIHEPEHSGQGHGRKSGDWFQGIQD